MIFTYNLLIKYLLLSVELSIMSVICDNIVAYYLEFFNDNVFITFIMDLMTIKNC